MTDTNELLESGMRRQLAAFHEALAAGMPRIGWKVGFNDPAVQQRMGLSGPIAGWLDGRRSFADGETYSAPAGAKPRIEAETAIRIGADVPAGSTLEFARNAISAVAPAFELVDATKPLSPLDELLANDILHEGVLLGADMPLATALGLVANGFPAVSVNGQARCAGIPGRYPDDLAEIVLNVANTLATYGEQLLAGDIIIGGSYIDPFDIGPGETIEADFGPLGKITTTIR